jgi:hypothetical protein
MEQNSSYVFRPGDNDKSSEKEEHGHASDGQINYAVDPTRGDGVAAGEVYDPYGGKKLGMIRVCDVDFPCKRSKLTEYRPP